MTSLTCTKAIGSASSPSALSPAAPSLKASPINFNHSGELAALRKLSSPVKYSSVPLSDQAEHAPIQHAASSTSLIMSTVETQTNSPATQEDDIMAILRPPKLPPSTSLNKALFSKTLNLAAASVRDNKNLSKLRQALSKNGDILPMERISAIAPDPDTDLAAKGRKCLLLKPSISPKQPETWGPLVSQLVNQEEVGIIPYELKLDYDYWNYRDVLSTLLPEELHDDIPSGFNTAGHVAHLNLRDQHLPYKMLIGQVIVEKNQHIRTVINKTDNVGTESEFRTFGYELLAGEDDLNVELNENGCVFKFDYSKVYWNSKLEKEHTRLVRSFQPGEVVCDVMAGIGPFAVPAGKRGVFVWANDYNPESYKYLQDAIGRNKVGIPFLPRNHSISTD